jgi:glycosyltransferase involved in cell wall biosynthesis
MKIILATAIFPPDIGGPATYTERLAAALTERNFNAVVLAYSDDKNSKFKIQNSKLPIVHAQQFKTKNYNFLVVKVSRKYPKFIRHFIYFYKLLKLARDADIIYAQNLFSAGIPGLLAAKLRGKKFLVKVVGDYVWERFGNPDEALDDFQKQKQNWKIKFLKKIQAGLAKKADKIIAPSHYLKKVVEVWGVPSEKIAVVYNAASNFSEFNLSKEEAKRELAIEGEVLLSVGRLVGWKGFRALIEIMPELLSEVPNLQLVIVGEGPEKEYLETEIKILNLEDRIKLSGKITPQQLSLYFKAADIFVLNSSYEGLSHTILEAMQSGVPIITTNICGNQELITDGENGLLIEYNQKSQLKERIVRLIKDRILQQNFIRKSQERVKVFTWSRLVDETLKVFNS